MKRVTIISLVVVGIILLAAFWVISGNQQTEESKEKLTSECQSKCAAECAGATGESDCYTNCASRCSKDSSEVVVPGSKDCLEKHAQGDCDHSK